ncbi:MAG TPA: hypothetical protein VJS44_08280 [Pyrinomonadaceae bacterium]|nr:hypothetical protein [Pyrinomonadaceae bacterium]
MLWRFIKSILARFGIRILPECIVLGRWPVRLRVTKLEASIKDGIKFGGWLQLFGGEDKEG